MTSHSGSDGGTCTGTVDGDGNCVGGCGADGLDPGTGTYGGNQ